MWIYVSCHSIIMEKPHKQFFVSDVSSEQPGWCPIDHFFYATYITDKQGKLINDKNNIVTSIECVGTRFLVRDSGEYLWFDDRPSALRHMADLIEKQDLIDILSEEHDDD